MTLLLVLIVVSLALGVWLVWALAKRKAIPSTVADLRHVCLRTLEQHRKRMGPLCPNNRRLVEFALALGGATDGPTRDPDDHFDTCKACEGLVRQLARAVREKRKGASRTRPSAA